MEGRRATAEGEFHQLLGDLIGIICAHLDTRDLVTLRRVSHHWSRWSRLPRSWVSSYWRFFYQLDSSTLSALCDAAPYLRSLRLPECWSEGGLPSCDVIAGLESLESLHFGNQMAAADLLRRLPHLRHFELSRAIGNRSDGPAFDVLCAKETGLISMRQVVASLLPKLSLSTCATTLVSLDIHTWVGRIELASFSALEEVYLVLNDQDVHQLGQDIELTTTSVSALASAPALRILTITHPNAIIQDEHIKALLSTPALAQRLEYLELEPCSFGRASVRRIMEECTSLLTLRIKGHGTARYRR